MKTKTKVLFFIAIIVGVIFVSVLILTLLGYRISDIGTNIGDKANHLANEWLYIDSYNENNIYEFVDKATGVHYLVYSYKAGNAGMGGITPRLNSDGSLVVDP